MRKKSRGSKVHEIIGGYSVEDAETVAMLEAYEYGELIPAGNQSQIRKVLQAAASAHLAKNARVNIRLSDFDLLQLKSRAAEEGMPYQTLIASILHKFIHGSLIAKA